ncbi:putative neuropeptide precursor protein isoform X2 [Nymphalis io]|uniref:putative neuropeptide precursor protein isoform X2 n=1 Tax=Inachis io TaxID=171585 RepID=UPI002168259E|nr:putative neuropeptide precursor protein isoform X2 [Nymphalis io]
MLLISLTAVFAVLVVNNAEPVPNTKGNSEGYDQAVEQRYESPQSNGELDNLIMRPELYGEPPAMEGLSGGYETRRRKRGSGKVGGAGAATKVATKSGSGKKNLKVNDAPTPVDFVIQENDNNRRKRGSGTKVSGAAASAKTATKNSGGNKKNFRSVSERRKRDSGLSAADVRALLNFWEAQERRKQDLHAASRNAEVPYYGNINTLDLGQPEVDEVGDIWLRDEGAIDPRERDYPRQSYFSEQNRVGVGLPEIYPVDPNELMQRYEEARRKRMYVNKMKRFMVARKRSDMHQNNYRPRDDLYTLAELLRSAPRVQEQDIPVYRRLIL